MNTAKILAYVWSALGIVVGLVQIVVPILPKEWGDFVTAVLALLAFYHINQSHTPAALGKAGFVQK